MSGPYDDIIHLPHHVSANRPHMSLANRAAQFSPFAALAGYDAAIDEAARPTGERVEPDEDAIHILNTKLRMLADSVTECPQVAITYFRPDEKKAGGAYVTSNGALKKIDNYKGVIVLMSGEQIAIRDILDIASELFKVLI